MISAVPLMTCKIVNPVVNLFVANVTRRVIQPVQMVNTVSIMARQHFTIMAMFKLSPPVWRRWRSTVGAIKMPPVQPITISRMMSMAVERCHSGPLIYSHSPLSTGPVKVHYYKALILISSYLTSWSLCLPKHASRWWGTGRFGQWCSQRFRYHWQIKITRPHYNCKIKFWPWWTELYLP